MEKIVWQPALYSKGEIDITLDKKFALDMIQAKIPAKNQNCLNQWAKENFKHLNFCQDPYLFHEDSGFVKQIYIGHNGIGLHVNHYTIDSLLKNDPWLNEVKYNSHEANSPYDKYALMALFSGWIEYSDVLIGK